MSLLAIKIFAAACIFLITVISGFASARMTKHKHILPTAHALANGIFIGVALFHLIPESAHSFKKHLLLESYFYAGLWTLVGLGLLLFLEKWALNLVAPDRHRLTSFNAFLLATLLSINSFIEGSVLGLGNTYYEVMLVLSAILMHKSCAAFALVMSFIEKRVPTLQMSTAFLVFAAATPLGILFSAYLLNTQHTLDQSRVIAYFNALAAGTFLYIGGVHLVENLLNKFDSKQQLPLITMTSIGMALMGLLAFW